MQDSSQPHKFSIVIPTYNRGLVLLDTIRYLLSMYHQLELIVVDQTQDHTKEIIAQLEQWHHSGEILWITRDKPSVVEAMNVGLLAASSDYVLFLDDDIRPCEGLVEQHQRLFESDNFGIVAGRVIQPWDNPEGDQGDTEFSFNSLKNGEAQYFIGANFAVKRVVAIELGGFDESFMGTSHDYEREFSDRTILAGYKIGYCGLAAVFHLKEESGGIRTYGHFLKTAKPHAAVGAYYYILRSKLVRNKSKKIAQRLFQRLVTKTHLKQPWWIPATLIGDCLGIFWAIRLRISEPRYIKHSENTAPKRRS